MTIKNTGFLSHKALLHLCSSLKNENPLPKVQQRHVFVCFFSSFMLDSNLICPLKYGIVNKITLHRLLIVSLGDVVSYYKCIRGFCLSFFLLILSLGFSFVYRTSTASALCELSPSG